MSSRAATDSYPGFPRPSLAFWILFVAAAFYFTANINHLSLLPGDDCYYARKGVEMLEHGSFFTVTWNGNPTFQNPPLHFWILARSFEFFGENDFSARLPTVLMALGLLVITWRIGLRTVGRTPAIGGVGILLVTPLYLEFSRRCMIEIPNAFWVSLVILVFLEGYRKPQIWLLLSAPLAGALLTKSLLGLMPVGVAVIASLLVRSLRPALYSRWFWAGIGLGILGGAAWPLHQGWTLGWHAVKAHYVGEIGARAAGIEDGSSTDIVAILLGFVIGYPSILLKRFQPVLIPGLVGVIAALVQYWKGKWWQDLAVESTIKQGRPAESAPRGAELFPEGPVLLAVWVVLPILVFSFSAARSARYLFPLLIPLALLGAWVVVDRLSPFIRKTLFCLVPVLLAITGSIFWISPHKLTRDLDAPFKRQSQMLESLLPAGTNIPLLGQHSWGLANPLLYYGKHAPEPALNEVSTAVLAAEQLPRAVLVIEAERRDDLHAGGHEFVEIAQLRDWVVVELNR